MTIERIQFMDLPLVSCSYIFFLQFSGKEKIILIINICYKLFINFESIYHSSLYFDNMH